MRTLRTLFSACGLLLALAASAQKPDAFDVRFASISVLQDRRVQAEMGVTAAQRDRMNAAANKYNALLRSLEERLKGVKSQSDPALKRLIQEQRTASETLRKSVLAELSGAQTKRLREITLQQGGLPLLGDEALGTRVGLSPAKRKMIRDTYNAGKKTANTLIATQIKLIAAKYSKMKPKTDAEKQKIQKAAMAEVDASKKALAPKVRALRQQTDAKIKRMLTPAEMAAYQKLLGKPFKPPAAKPK